MLLENPCQALRMMSNLREAPKGEERVSRKPLSALKKITSDIVRQQRGFVCL